MAGSLGMVAAPAQATEEDTTSRGVTIPAFYNPPSSLPAQNGELIRSEPMDLFLRISGPYGSLPGKATRIMFKSTDAANKPVAVTGAYIEPSKKWTGKGNRPLVVVASGTVGAGDQCAPSISLEAPLVFDLEGKTLGLGYDLLAVYNLLGQGVGVVFTDYVGLGNTDRIHTYMNRLDQAHTVNDAARAALQLSGTSLKSNSKVGFYGYSQGGGAAGAAAELQPTYAPELNLAGAYVGAPPADLVKTIDGIDGSVLASALAWTINGILYYHPEFTQKIDEYMNDKGKDVLAKASNSCIGEAILGNAFTKTKDLTKTGISLTEVLNKEPQIKTVVETNRIGKIKPAVPVRVATAIVDDTVPHKQARQLAVDWCKLRGDVTYDAIKTPNLGNKLVIPNHLLPMIVDQPTAVSWMTDRLNGKRHVSNCLVVPIPR